MNIFKKIYTSLNGHKTAIGGTLIAIGTVLTGTTVALPGLPAIVIPILIPVLVPFAPYIVGAGAILGGVGWFHKALKAGGIGLSDNDKIAAAAKKSQATGKSVLVETAPDKPNVTVKAV